MPETFIQTPPGFNDLSGLSRSVTFNRSGTRFQSTPTTFPYLRVTSNSPKNDCGVFERTLRPRSPRLMS